MSADLLHEQCIYASRRSMASIQLENRSAQPEVVARVLRHTAGDYVKRPWQRTTPHFPRTHLLFPYSQTFMKFATQKLSQWHRLMLASATIPTSAQKHPNRDTRLAGQGMEDNANASTPTHHRFPQSAMCVRASVTWTVRADTQLIYHKTMMLVPMDASSIHTYTTRTLWFSMPLHKRAA